VFEPRADWFGSAVAINDQDRIIIERLAYNGPLLWADGDSVTVNSKHDYWFSVTDINNSGTVAGTLADYGSRPVLLLNGQWVGISFSRSQAAVMDVNDANEAVGYSVGHPIADTHGFFWKAGENTELGSKAWISTVPTALNEHSQVVGSLQLPDSSTAGFIWESGELSLLTDLLSDDDWLVTEARGINLSGEILAMVRNRKDEQVRAALLTPMP
jgi:hypothetical protein